MLMEFKFPLKGKDQNWSYEKQPSETSPYLNNVRPYDPIAIRARGGKRPALRKRFSQQIGGASCAIDGIIQVSFVR